MGDHNNTGFNILLTVIAMIVMIGLVIFIFVLTMGELKSSVAETSSGNIINETVLFTDGAGSQVVTTGDNIQLNSVQVIRCGI